MCSKLEILLVKMAQKLARFPRQSVMGVYREAFSNVSEIYFPQGAALAPISFTLYINDLTNNLANYISTPYADDPSHLLTHRNDIKAKTKLSRKSSKNVRLVFK